MLRAAVEDRCLSRKFPFPTAGCLQLQSQSHCQVSKTKLNVLKVLRRCWLYRYATFKLHHVTVLCKLVVSLQMQNRKTTDKINEISIVPNPPNYSIVAIADQRALHLHFATDNQLAKPCRGKITQNKDQNTENCVTQCCVLHTGIADCGAG